MMADDMKIFVVNLNEPEKDTSSAWFSLPCDIDTLKETIGLSSSNEHYLISDFELPFEVSQDADLALLNDVCEVITSCDIPFEDIRAIQKAWFGNLKELEQGIFNITRYDKCSSMEEVATYLINELGELGEVSPQLYPYIDYKGYADTLETLGRFVCVHGVVYECHDWN